MAEYIELEAAVKAFNNFDAGRADSPPFTLLTPEEFAEYLYELPTADVAPVVHAVWMPSESDFDDDDTLFDVEEWCDWQCSACREDICYDDPMPIRLLPKYCPNCGAKMDGGADMAEYIERGVALREAKYAAVRGLDPVAFVEDVPVADVAPVVHARWIEDGSGIIICPKCNRGYNLVPRFTQYCPNCGAKMDGGDRKETT